MLLGLLLLAALSVVPTALHASEYDPPGLYDVDYFKLSNGFDVVLKKRTLAHSVSVRLAVNVGNRNFPCPKRETPHFLEHLLFMGTSKHSEAGLQRLIQDHGGAWNGYTSATQTGYQIDIFDKHLFVAIDTLYEMMTDTVITPKTIESARAVIHRERSGKLSNLVQWLYEMGIMKPAVSKASDALLPGDGAGCPGFISPEGIEETDVRNALKSYYVPSNMTLVVVGSFDRDSLVAKIKTTFGKLPPRASNGDRIVTPPYPTEAKSFTGTLSPLVGNDATIGLSYRTDGSTSPDYYALWVAWRYLNRQLYENIRVDKALSYSPASAYGAGADYGIFLIATDVNLDKIETAKALLEQQIENIKEGHIKAEDIEAAKQRILLERVQGYEANRDIAAYYVGSLPELKTNGKLSNHEDSIARITLNDVQRAAQKYLRADRQIAFVTTPTLTFTQFFMVLGFLILALTAGSVYLVRSIARRRYKRAQETI